MTVLPSRALSSVGVPSAMTRPSSTTAMRSARRSASSRYCVVSSTVAPSPTSSPIISHRSAALGVEPGGRLVEEQHRRSVHQGGGQVEAPAHAARVGARGRSRGVGQVEPLEQLVGRGVISAWGRWASLPIRRRFSRPGQVVVDGGVLAGQADRGARLRLADTSMPEHLGAAAVGRAGWS